MINRCRISLNITKTIYIIIRNALGYCQNIKKLKLLSRVKSTIMGNLASDDYDERAKRACLKRL